MTDIEVGSLWGILHDTQPKIEVQAMSRKSVIWSYVGELNEHLTDINTFLKLYKPYTPPKEYKVWVYESKCGNVEVYRESQCEYFSARNGFMTLKAILTGKEGEGL